MNINKYYTLSSIGYPVGYLNLQLDAPTCSSRAKAFLFEFLPGTVLRSTVPGRNSKRKALALELHVGASSCKLR